MKKVTGRVVLLPASMLVVLVVFGGVALAAVSNGTSGPNRIVGTSGGDRTSGGAGSDTIWDGPLRDRSTDIILGGPRQRSYQRQQWPGPNKISLIVEPASTL